MTTRMGRVTCDLTISADGYSAGPNQTEQRPCGGAIHRGAEAAAREDNWRDCEPRRSSMSAPDWQLDLLGDGYRQHVLHLGSDPDGEGFITAVRTGSGS
jgi:hypothetical protein